MSNPTTVYAPLQALIVEWLVAPGDTVRAGDVLLILEAMKMEHEVRAEVTGRVLERFFEAGEAVDSGVGLLSLAPISGAPVAEQTADAPPMAAPGPRNDWLRWQARQMQTLDAARPQAVAKRHALGLRTARENIADLCDEDSFIEYGALAVAAQRQRRSEEDLIANTPADGMVTGIGSVNGLLFGEDAARTVVMAYDATVLAGTQGMRNHQKTDRLLGIALAQRLPVVLFAEGGGGRPGDTDMPIVAGLHVGTFAAYARLSGQVPVVGVVFSALILGEPLSMRLELGGIHMPSNRFLSTRS